MKTKKKLKDLTLKDNFMFGAVMMEANNCRDFLELALGLSVDHVEVSKEKSIAGDNTESQSQPWTGGTIYDFQEMLREEYAEGKAEGKAEGVLNLLEEQGEISDDLRNRIISEKDLDVLKRWLKQAAKSESLEEFIEKMW